jgi:hypothetical protein
VRAFVGLEEIDDVGDGVIQLLDGSRGSFS